ncbi:hypothetical protein ACFWAN_52640 [Streptomyces mirabilis]|uniref:hypothetical protein n=1 Tax=Streptomyces mirabilis TaxID=68239 RepID=UPI00364FB496
MAAATQFVDARVSRYIGTFSEAVAVPAGAMQVVVSGTPGLRPDGSAGGFRRGGRASLGQRVALRCAGAELSDIVQARSQLTDRDDTDT